MMAIVAVASVKVTPDLTDFRRELEAELKAYKPEVTVKAVLDTKRAKADLDAFVKREDGKTIKKKVDLDTSAFDKIGKAGGSISSLGGSIQKATIAGTVLISTVQALGPLLLSAAGAAALLPAALIGGVGALAAFKLGADGIKKAFDGLKPSLDTLKASVSKSFEQSLTPGIKNLAKVLPQVTVGLKSIASAFGGIFTQVTKMLTATDKAGQVNVIFIEMSMVIQNIGRAIAPVISALINIGEIGMPLFVQLTKGIGAAAQKFEAWTASAEGGAKIASVIQGSVNAFKQIGAILQQVGGIITNVFSGIGLGAENLGGTVLPVLTAINQALGSEAGQQALAALGAAVTALGSAFASQLGPAIQAVLPYLTQALNFIATHADTIAPIVAGFTLFGGILSKVAGPLGSLIGLLSKMGPILEAVFSIIKGNPILLLVGGIVAALAATGQLNPILELLGQVLKPIMAAVQQLISALLPPLKTLFQALAPIFTVVAQVIAALVQALAPIIGLVAQLISALLPPLVQLFTSILTPVLDLAAAFLGPIIQAISGVIKWVVDLTNQFGGLPGILTLIKVAFTNAWNNIKAVWSAVSGFFSGIWNAIVSSVQIAINTVKTTFTTAWSIIKGVWSGVGSFFSGIWSSIGNGLRGALNGAIRLLNGAINGINKITGAIGIPGIPNIPYLAEGGTIQSQGTVMVGEAGPELLTLPRGAQVTPLSGRNAATFEGGSGADVEVNLYVDSDKLKDFIDVRVDEGNRVTKRTVRRGTSR